MKKKTLTHQSTQTNIAIDSFRKGNGKIICENFCLKQKLCALILFS